MFIVHNIRKLPAVFIIFILIFPFVSSLGITPSHLQLDFYPGLSKNFTFKIINNVGYDTYVMPTVSGGDLGEYITAVQKEKILIPNGGAADLTYQLILPKEIETPGNHNIFVGAVETITPSFSGGAGIVAITGVAGMITIFVPYPGKYLDIGFSGEDVAINAPVHFTVDFRNRGKVKLNYITGKIDVYDQETKLETLALPVNRDLDIYDSRQIVVNWNTSGRKVGVYRGELTLEYDGIPKKRNATFHIGEESLEIINFTKELEADKISKFAIAVHSVWNSQLTNVWAEVKILKNGKAVQELKTPITEIGPWETMELVAYFDGNGVALGDYDVEIKVHYNNKVAEAKGIITVIKPKPTEKAPISEAAKPTTGLLTQSTIFLGIAILAILLLIINILVTLRRKK